MTIFSAVKFTGWVANSRSYVGAIWAIPGIIGGILLITLPEHKKVGLLFSYWTARAYIFFTLSFLLRSD